VSISGEEFEKRVESFSDLLIKNNRNALLKNSYRMMTLAKLYARSRMNQITANLRKSIYGTVLAQGDNEYLMLRAGGYSTPRTPYEESADVSYAVYQEFGTKFIRPKWYMRDAFEKILPRVNPDLNKALKAALNGKIYG
jgi:hypothetical protein